MADIITGPGTPFEGVTDPTKVPVQESTATQTHFDSGLQQLGVRPTSKWDMWWENVGQNLEDETTAFATKEYLHWKRGREFQGTKLSPDEANKLYPGMPEPFTEPVDPVLAQFAYNEFKRRESNRVWKERGPETGMAFEFTSAIPGAVADPINLALNYVTGAALAGTRLAGKMVGVFGENVVQNIATEALVRHGLEAEAQPRSIGESGFNVIAGAAGGTGMHYAFRFFGDALDGMSSKVRESVQKIPPGRVRNTVVRMIKAHENGQKIDPSSPVKPGVVDPAPAGVDADAAHASLAHPSERAFYLPEHGETQTPVRLGNDYGGVTVVDNPTHARNSAAGDAPGDHGFVREVTIPPEAKFASLDLPASDPLVAKLIGELKASGLEIKVGDGATLRDVLDQAKAAPEGITKTKAAFKKEGVAGYTEVIDTPAGKTNAAHILDAESVRVGEPMQIDPDKLPEANQAEIDRLEAAQNAPENGRYYDPSDRKLVDPEAPEPLPAEQEAAKSWLELKQMTESSPELKRFATEIEDIEKYETGLVQAAQEIITSTAAGGDPVALRSELLKHGIAASSDDLDALVSHIESLKNQSLDEVEFRAKTEEFLRDEMSSWPIKRKLERIMNAKKTVELITLAQQTEGGRKSVVDNLVDLINGGGRRFGKGANLNTLSMAESFELQFLRKMKQALGQNLKVAESGLLEREITQEMANLQAGGKSMVSGSKQAFEIAKVYNDLQEHIFQIKAGYSPFLEKIADYFYRQTHDRERIAAVSREQWVSDAYRVFGSGFEDEETAFKKLGEIYNAIVEGRFHSSIFDRQAGDHNLAFRLANKRVLRPKDWVSFFEYNSKYGQNVHLTMIETARSSARDIAVMSKLGNTPRSNVEQAIKYLSKQDPKIAKEFDDKMEKILDAMHYQTFAWNREAVATHARVIQGTQKLVTLASNGATFLRAIVDFASAFHAVKDLGGASYLENWSNLFWGYTKNFAKGHAKAVEFAEEFGAFAESVNRNLYVELGGGSRDATLDKMLDLHSIVSIARRHKSAMTAAMGEMVSRRLAEFSEMKWAELPAQAKQALLRYGIDEAQHKWMKHGVREIGGRKYFSTDRLHLHFLKMVKEGATVLDEGAPEILEKLPRVVEKHSDSVYMKPGSGYYEMRNEAFYPRTGERAEAELWGADAGPLPAYSVDSAAKLASEVHQKFAGAGFSEVEAGVAASLHSTFFDSLGKYANKDPLELWKAYDLKVAREPQRPGVGGFLMAASRRYGGAVLSTKPGVALDKTVIHESAHFFLEAMTDIHRMEGLDPAFKAELDGFYKWLGVKDFNVSSASHERFANSFEAYLRTNKAPEGLEKLFAMLRDWYRRAFEMVRRGFQGIPVSLANAERGPQHVEDFYKKLLGGSGPSELHGPLTYRPETMSPAELYSRKMLGEVTRLPNHMTDLMLKFGSIVNDQVRMATTSPGQAERAMMYGRDDINSVKGAVWRAAWQFKSSTVKAYDSMQRSRFSNPEKPDGDWTKVAHFVLMSMGLYTLQDQAENLLNGKTPENPATPEYALKAMVASGAGNVIGDALVSALAENTSAFGMSQAILRSAIPSATRAVDAISAAATTARSMVDEKTEFPGMTVGRVLTQNIPYQNIFYTKAMLHFYLLNGIREELGPGFLGTLERNTAKKHGLFDERQEYFMLRPTESNLWTRELY